MFFDNYKQHPKAKLRASLLWEYELNDFDWNAMRNIVLQRVVERGRINDFYAALNKYGINEFKEGIKSIPYLNAKDLAFVCTVFGLKKRELKCYTQKRLHKTHWNS